MTKADLYKRRYKNKQRKSSASEPGTSTSEIMEPEEIKETSLIETINNLKNRMNKSSIENDVELIKANTQDTPVTETPEPNYSDDDDDIPPIKPVERTYAKLRSKLDDFVYLESSQPLEGTEVAFPKTTRPKKSKSPVPRKRRKVEPKKKAVNGERELRSKVENGKSAKKTKEVEKRVLRSKSVTEKTRATKESIENEKTVATTRVTRKRKYEEITKPVLREKGQNGRSSRKNSNEPTERKIVRAKKTKTEPLKVEIEDAQNVRMTRSRRRRLEISLSPSEVKSVVPAFSFESDRRVNSIESNRSAKSNTKAKRNTKAKASAKATKAKKARATRAKQNRR